MVWAYFYIPRQYFFLMVQLEHLFPNYIDNFTISYASHSFLSAYNTYSWMVRKHLHWRSLVGWDVHTSSLQFSFWMLHPFLRDLLYCRHHWSVGWLSLNRFHHFQPYTNIEKNLTMKLAYFLKPQMFSYYVIFWIIYWFWIVVTASSIMLLYVLATFGTEIHYLALMHVMQAQTTVYNGCNK